MGPLALRIENIGSTAVPGLGTKDVIDVQITVASLSPEVRHSLIEAGYQHSEAITLDHVPLGMFGSRATRISGIRYCFATIYAPIQIRLDPSN